MVLRRVYRLNRERPHPLSSPSRPTRRTVRSHTVITLLREEIEAAPGSRAVVPTLVDTLLVLILRSRLDEQREIPRRPGCARRRASAPQFGVAGVLGDDRGITAPTDRGDRTRLAHRMTGGEPTLGAVVARLEAREREITTQAETVREQITQLTARLDELVRAADEVPITRKTPLALPAPGPPAPPDGLRRPTRFRHACYGSAAARVQSPGRTASRPGQGFYSARSPAAQASTAVSEAGARPVRNDPLSGPASPRTSPANGQALRCGPAATASPSVHPPADDHQWPHLSSHRPPPARSHPRLLIQSCQQPGRSRNPSFRCPRVL